MMVPVQVHDGRRTEVVTRGPDQRIAVVGAGLAGLSAALRLREAGRDVVVFEARDRVGGRVWSETVETDGGACVIERGGEFVLEGYDAMRRLLRREGLALADTGMSYYVREVAETPSVTPAQLVAAAERGLAVAAERADLRSVADVLEALSFHPDVIDALRARVETTAGVGADLADASLLEHLAHRTPPPSWRVAGGNQRLPDALARRLEAAVRLGEPVRRIVDDGGEVQVATAAGTASFDAVVVALPVAVVHARDAVDIALPDWKRQVLAKVLQGHAAKLHLPLRSAPDTSAVMSVRERYWTWTALAEGRRVAPVLNCFMGSEPAIRALRVAADPATWVQRARALRADLRFDDIRPPTVTVWATDQYARCAYSCPSPGFTADDHALLERPVGSIHFAGEHVEPEMAGLMEGAVRSGERAADRLLGAA
jgi:monoamine oxidase